MAVTFLRELAERFWMEHVQTTTDEDMQPNSERISSLGVFPGHQEPLHDHHTY